MRRTVTIRLLVWHATSSHCSPSLQFSERVSRSDLLLNLRVCGGPRVTLDFPALVALCLADHSNTDSDEVGLEVDAVRHAIDEARARHRRHAVATVGSQRREAPASRILQFTEGPRAHALPAAERRLMVCPIWPQSDVGTRIQILI